MDSFLLSLIIHSYRPSFLSGHLDGTLYPHRTGSNIGVSMCRRVKENAAMNLSLLPQHVLLILLIWFVWLEVKGSFARCSFQDLFKTRFWSKWCNQTVVLTQLLLRRISISTLTINKKIFENLNCANRLSW